MTDYSGLQNYLQAARDRVDPFIPPVYQDIVNDNKEYEKGLLETGGVFLTQHSGVNIAKKLLTKSGDVLSEEERSDLLESLGKGEGKEGLTNLAKKLTGRGFKKLGNQMKQQAERFKSKVTGEPAEPPPAPTTVQETSFPTEPAPAPAPAPEPEPEPLDLDTDEGVKGLIRRGLGKITGGDGGDVEKFGSKLAKGLAKAGEIDAQGGGPEDILGDVAAAGAAIASLLSGRSVKTHKDAFVTPTYPNFNYESSAAQQIG
jgi:hypothetical protein